MTISSGMQSLGHPYSPSPNRARLSSQSPSPDIGFFKDSDWDNWRHYGEFSRKGIEDKLKSALKGYPTQGSSVTRDSSFSVPSTKYENKTLHPISKTPQPEHFTTPSISSATMTDPRRRGQTLVRGPHVLPSTSRPTATGAPVLPMSSMSADSIKPYNAMNNLRNNYLRSQKSAEDVPMNRRSMYAQYNPSPMTENLRRTFSGLKIQQYATTPRKSLGLQMATARAGDGDGYGYGNEYADPRKPSLPYQSKSNINLKTTSARSRSRPKEWRSDGRVARPNFYSARELENQGSPPPPTDLSFEDNPEDPVEHQPNPILKRTKSANFLHSRRSAPLSLAGRGKSTETLGKLTQPVHVRDAYAKLKSSDWADNIQGLTDIVNIAKQNPNSLKGEMTRINMAAMEHLGNNRSQLCREACLFFKEMFVTFKRGMESEIEKIAGKLLEKSADTSKFIQEDAIAALEAMVSSFLPAKTISILANAQTNGKFKNTLIQTTGARLMELLVTNCEARYILEDVPAKALPILITYLQASREETRNYAKRAFASLVIEPKFESVLRRHISSDNLHDVSKILAAVKKGVIGC